MEDGGNRLELPTAASGQAPAKLSKSLKKAVANAQRRKPDGSLVKATAKHEAKRKLWLQTPAAKRERAKSRTQFADLPSSKASEVAIKKQPSVAVKPAWSAPSVEKGDKIASYASANVARIHTGSKDVPDMLVQSIGGPIAVQTVPGEFVAEDMTLQKEATTGTWTPKAATVDTTLPSDLSDPVVIGSNPERQLKVTPAHSKAKSAVISGRNSFTQTLQKTPTRSSRRSRKEHRSTGCFVLRVRL